MGLNADQLVALCGQALAMAESPDARRAAIARLAGSEPRRRGGISSEQQARLGWRNGLLVALWHAHDEWSRLDAPAAATAISAAALRYRSTTWLRQRSYAGPPPSEPNRTFWEIYSIEMHVPRKRQLIQILERAEQ